MNKIQYQPSQLNNNAIYKISKWKTIKNDLVRHKYIYIMLIPVVLYYLIFQYQPMYGAQIAFRDFSPRLGLWKSEWVGLKYFTSFFNNYYFWRILRNTVVISFYDIIFGFPAPIILALLLNEIRSSFFKRTVQTITYLPHFISMVVICGMIVDFLASDGIINSLIQAFGGNSKQFLIKPEWFRTIYVGSGIWQGIGWGSIIYLAALSGINPELYEASVVDGANRWKQTINITIPGILPTIIIMFILRIGSMLSVGSEKILLLYNPNTYETADVISTFVYRKGILEMDYSFSTAVGLFNSIINFVLLLVANRMSKKISEVSLW